MTPWVAAALIALAAVVFFFLWRRARAAGLQAERQLAQTRQAAAALEHAMQQVQAQLESLFQAEPEAALVIDADRTVISLNPAARALFGPQAMPGQTLMVATRSAELDELAAHALAGGADCDRQLALGRWAQPYRARAVASGAAGEYGAALVVTDLSELQRLGRARRDFVANISHELRTPLTSIRLLVDTLRGPAALDDGARNDLLEKIAVEIETLGQLARELLDLAQIESGQVMVRMVPVPVATLAAEVAARLAPQAARKALSVSVEVPSELVALADVDQVSRALGNLLHNAIKFTPDGGRIWIRGGRREGDIALQVADSGPGIAPGDLPRVFERFFRADRSRASGGTGLGLAIARHVVEAHGGRIWVESEGRAGQGATFHFTLPAA